LTSLQATPPGLTQPHVRLRIARHLARIGREKLRGGRPM
jgi:hypothetical protein